MQARFTSGLLHYSYSLTKQTQRSRKGERVCCSGDGERQEEGEREREEESEREEEYLKVAMTRFIFHSEQMLQFVNLEAFIKLQKA